MRVGASLLILAALTGCQGTPSDNPHRIPVAQASSAQIAIITDDIERFWEAYDAIRRTDDPEQQLTLLQTLYIDRGTPGLHAFMEAKGYSAQTYIDAIRAYPKYWDSVRPKTGSVRGSLGHVKTYLDRLRQLYPRLNPANVYFQIGALRSAGTTLDDKVLIGVEMAMGDTTVDTSEMSPGLRRFFSGYFASKPAESLDLLIVHEAVHTQERGDRTNLLSQAIYEGVADFVAEQVTGRMPDLPYVTYGPANDAQIKAAFVRDMNKNDYSDWLYNGTDNAFGVRDLGYYVGYAICARYYARSPDKKRAIREMIELNFADPVAVETFANRSGYFTD
ncbi:MAG: hypothetical protein CVT78_12250 [Alphaproteobacteria bacterium HGW-Alphaproteobacteria-17]|nr:MAG: hypothetical protein CVT78_12250 [Alphaproteobacteria bacterium HGW-Alphaproteobacteria-17]